MIKVSVKLDKRRKLKNGKYPLKIKIARKDSALYISTGYDLLENEWDAENEKIIKRTDKKQANLRVTRLRLNVCDRIMQLQDQGKLRLYNNKKLLDYICNEYTTEDIRERLFKTQFDSLIKEKDNLKTIEFYQTTMSVMQEYCDLDRLSVDDINSEWLTDFSKWLKNTRKNKQNTIAIRLKIIKAVITHAKNKGIEGIQAFDGFKIRGAETTKRALSIEQLRLLYSMQLPKSLAKYRDLFFLIFFLMGINFIDLSRLTKIENGRILYKRAKTGSLYDIKVEPEAMQIITRYQGKKQLLSFFDNIKIYTNAHVVFQKALKKIGRLIGEPNLTTYWARHSFATVAYEIGVPIDIIAGCLGHKSAHKMTEIYIKKDTKKIDEANRKVIDFLLYNKT